MNPSEAQNHVEEDIPATVLITTYNRRDDLRTCLQALPWPTIEQTNTEVLVYDDGSTDDTATMTAAEFTKARLLTQTNRGLCAARNHAASAAKGRLIIIIDDDVIVQEGWLDAILKNDDQNTILGGRVLDIEGDRVQSGPARYTFIGKRLPCHPQEATVGTGCNLAIPTQVFRDLGGFDEELDEYGFEESDFCIRANKAGYPFRYLQDATVRHKGTEVKHGRAIHTQERNSTYAMLKAYTNSKPRLIAFILLNTAWLLLRLILWPLTGRHKDALHLLKGAIAAYSRYFNR